MLEVLSPAFGHAIYSSQELKNCNIAEKNMLMALEVMWRNRVFAYKI
jgi:hypothetical protein